MSLNQKFVDIKLGSNQTYVSIRMLCLLLMDKPTILFSSIGTDLCCPIEAGSAERRLCRKSNHFSCGRFIKKWSGIDFISFVDK